MPEIRPYTPLRAPEPERLSSPARKKRLLRNVAIVHALVLLLPLGVWFAADRLGRREQKETITVTLTSGFPRSRQRLRPAPQTARRTPLKQNRVRLKPPKPQPPKAKPAPPVRRTAARTPKPKPAPVRARAKEKPAPRRQTPPKSEPREKSREPNDNDLVPVSSLPTEPPTQSAQEDELAATYGEALVGALYELWKPPSDALLAGRRPMVSVRITVNASGRIVKREILKRSGFAPMDESVHRLLESLSDLPKPPPGQLIWEINFVPVE